MPVQKKLEFKKRLHQNAIAIIRKRVENSLAAMQQAQASANEEEKSSAGDKYETSRAMSHLEKDMYAKQASENEKELAFLASINCDKVYDEAVAGSLIDCGEIFFFIGAGLGKIDFEERIVYLLSVQAPLSKLLFNKRQGDTITFLNKAYSIKSIC